MTPTQNALRFLQGARGSELLLLWSANGSNFTPDAVRDIAALAFTARVSHGEDAWLAIGELKGLFPDGARQGSRLRDLDSWLGAGALESLRSGPDAFEHQLRHAMAHDLIRGGGGTDLRRLVDDARVLTQSQPSKIIFSTILNDQPLSFNPPSEETATWLAGCDVCVATNAIGASANAARFFQKFGSEDCLARTAIQYPAGDLAEMNLALSLKHSLLASTPQPSSDARQSSAPRI